MVLELVRPVRGRSEYKRTSAPALQVNWAAMKVKVLPPKQGEYTTHTPAGV